MRTMSQKRPLVTVLMPVYNSPDIYASVDSVLMQRYSPIQFILIDDRSADFSAWDMRAYLDSKARGCFQSWTVLENEENLGTVKTLNRGLRMAQGEIVFNLAGDDLFYDELVLEDWVRAFRETNALVMTGIRENYDRGFAARTGEAPTRRQAEWLKTLPSDALFERLVLDHFVSGASTARTRRFFQEYGLYDEDYRLIEDFPADLRLLRTGGRIEFFDRKVIKYRGGGMSSMGAVDPFYERDMYLIFKNEICPYTRSPERAESWLRRWEKDVAFDRKYVKLEEEYGKTRVMRTFLRAWYYAHHPVQAVRRSRS